MINHILRDIYNKVEEYEPIALIEHQGAMLEEELTTYGHYICDLKVEKCNSGFEQMTTKLLFKSMNHMLQKKPLLCCIRK